METLRETSPAGVTGTLWVRWQGSAESLFVSKEAKRSETVKMD